MSRTATSLTAVRAAFNEIIDYAGLFPPARLDLDPAIRNFARYRREPEAWMLSRFVCPIQRLREFTNDHDHLFKENPGFRFSGLSSGGDTAPAFLANLRDDATLLARFNQQHAGAAEVDAFEMKLPPGLAEDSLAEQVRRLLDDAADLLLENTRDAGASIFVEASLAGDWRSRIAAVVDGLVSHNAAHPDRRVGLKLRCGGLSAADFPTAEQVAFVIGACRDGEAPLKFTAGLHHPIRHFDASLGVSMHGFVNVFTAGILACVRDTDEETTRLIVGEERPQAFAFHDNGLSWGGYTVAPEEIEQARLGAVISFGSCSFDEPREDLHALNWL